RDWSSDVCSPDVRYRELAEAAVGFGELAVAVHVRALEVIALLAQRLVEPGVADGVGERRADGTGELLLLGSEARVRTGQAQEERAQEIVLTDQGLDEEARHPHRQDEIGRASCRGRA